MPTSSSFASSDAKKKTQIVANRVAALLLEAGAVVVEGLASEDEMDAVRADVTRDASGTFFGALGSFAGAHTTRNAGKPLGESTTVQALAVDAVVVGAAQKVLAPACKRVILGTCSVISVHAPPNDTVAPAPPQTLHRDDSMWAASDWLNDAPFCRQSGDDFGYEEEEPKYHLSVSAMWAVSEFSEKNGATRLVLGSHRQCPRTRDAPPDATLTSAAMPKGSVLLWLGGTFHGAGAHAPLEADDGILDADTTRRGLLFIYNLGWLRSEHNFHNAMPLDVIQRLPADLRDLVGYAGDNAVQHPWYTGPVYAQPYLGGPQGSAAGDGVQFAAAAAAGAAVETNDVNRAAPAVVDDPTALAPSHVAANGLASAASPQ